MNDRLESLDQVSNPAREYYFMRIMRLFSKVTSKGQVTIPAEVREKLGISAGDSVVFTVDGDTVTLKRAGRLDAGFLKVATESFSDWNAPEADDAFGNL